jgi:hypothetical protein
MTERSKLILMFDNMTLGVVKWLTNAGEEDFKLTVINNWL